MRIEFYHVHQQGTEEMQGISFALVYYKRAASIQISCMELLLLKTLRHRTP